MFRVVLFCGLRAHSPFSSSIFFPIFVVIWARRRPRPFRTLLVSRVLRLREDRPRTGLRFEQTAIPGRPFFLFHRCFFRLSVPVLLFCAYFLPYPFVCFPSSNYFHIIFVPRSFSLFVFCWTVFVSWWFFVLLFRSRNLVNLFSPDEITATPV